MQRATSFIHGSEIKNLLNSYDHVTIIINDIHLCEDTDPFIAYF